MEHKTPQQDAEVVVGKEHKPGKLAVQLFAVIVLLALVAGGVYYWQNSRIATLQNQVSDLKKQTTTVKTPYKVDPYKDWKTYTSSKEGLSFKYPATWTLTNIDCVNASTQKEAQCANLQSPYDSSGDAMSIHFQYNTDAASSKKSRIDEIEDLAVSGAESPLSLITYYTPDSQTEGLAITNIAVTNKQLNPPVSAISQATASTYYAMTGSLYRQGSQAPIAYSLATFKAKSFYNTTLLIYRSLSY